MSLNPSPDDLTPREIFDRYAYRLMALALRHLPAGLRPKVDAEDVVQSVFRSFFRLHTAGRFQFECEDDLRNLLVVITLRKCGRQVRRYFGPEHDVRKEEAGGPDGDAFAAQEVLDKEPTLEEAAKAAELLEQCLRPLDERERRVLVLHLEGWTAQELSAQVGLTRYTIEGMLKSIRNRLEHLRADTV